MRDYRKRFFVSLKSVIINVGTIFILDKISRKKIRAWAKGFSWKDFANYSAFVKTIKKEHSILIVEVNACHGCVLSGYVKYLIELGYQVKVLVDRRQQEENPLISFKKNRKVETCYLSGLFIENILKKHSNWFNNVIFTSEHYYDVLIKKKPIPIQHCFSIPKNSLFVVHHIDYLEEDFSKNLYAEDCVITLGKFNKGCFVCPVFYCPIIQHIKNKTTKFVVVGNMEPGRRGYNMLIDSAIRLEEEGREFIVDIIGAGDVQGVPEALKKHFNFWGRLDFERMYEVIKNADFLLTLLDPADPKHLRYITSGITGSMLLTYGFCKPCITHQMFAPFYKIDTSNSILYEGELIVGMRQAILMKEEQYVDLFEQISHLNKNISEESKKNLQRLLNQ